MKSGLRASYPKLKYLRITKKPDGRSYTYYAPPRGHRVRLPDIPQSDPRFLAAYKKAASRDPSAPRPSRGVRQKRRDRMLKIIERLCEKYRTEEISADLVASLIIDSHFPESRVLGITGAVPQDVRWAVFRRDKFTCRICGVKNVEMTLDHIFPVSQGGTNDPNNLQTACRPCNSAKHDKIPAKT